MCHLALIRARGRLRRRSGGACGYVTYLTQSQNIAVKD
jgi:hypothetical protein